MVGKVQVRLGVYPEPFYLNKGMVMSKEVVDLVGSMSARQKVEQLRRGFGTIENLKNAIRALDACDPKLGIDETYLSIMDAKIHLEKQKSLMDAKMQLQDILLRVSDSLEVIAKKMS